MRKFIPLCRNKKKSRPSLHYTIIWNFLGRDKIRKFARLYNCKHIADKYLVKDVINKVSMLVLLNLQQQIGLIFKTYLKGCSILLFIYFKENKSYSSRANQESLKKLYFAGLVIPYLLYMYLDYSINTLHVTLRL